MEGRGVRAHEAQGGCRRGGVMTGGLVKLRALMMDKEVDVGRVKEEVWFWDKSLVKAGVEQEVGGAPSWAHLLLLQSEVEGARVEWGAKEVVFPVLGVTYYPSPPQCWRLVCAPAGNGRTLRWFPALRGRDEPPQLTAR